MKCPCEKLNDGCQDWSELCVGNLWLFSGLQREELFEVSQKARRRTFSVGEAVFHQGDPAHSIYLIKSGQIKLSRVIENGAEIMLDILKPGDCLGEYLLNDLTSDYGYPVSAWCQSKVITCSFDRRAFEELILEFPAIGLKVIKTMAGRITSLTERLEAMSQTHLEDKLHAVLLNVARKHGHQRSV
ncbi:MAG: Crp/Fnr family transcriptional regulator, partial [Deltaproteobacteria bacterium]|nr:Crp/Fnr family transcriptional regulator [Deltaproteobacteria bacterium]